MDTHQRHIGRCPCGSVEFSLVGRPLCRGFCRCTICQKFNNADYADVTVFRASNLESIDESRITFKVHKQPPLVSRGTCAQCGNAAIEKLRIPLMPGMVIVPSCNVVDETRLPAPSMHIFYDKCVNEIDDGLKKYRGFIPSQIAFGAGLMKAMIAHRRG